jgi:CRP/FNR family transcriptional regulator, cyclic AMP receptor protein
MTETNGAHLLRKIDLFQALNEEELAKIEGLLVRRNYAEKETIFFQGEPHVTVYFIAEGRVKIYRNDEHGREQVVNMLHAGDMFPHVGFFRTDSVYPAHAMMNEDGVLLALSISRFRSLVESHPTLSLKLLSELESKYIELQARLAEMVMHDTFGRIVLQLVRLARLHGSPTVDARRTRLDMTLTHQELAGMVGTSRETVNRTINQLKKLDAVEVGADHHLIVDIDLLEKQV